jgi:hypothetical protein
MDQSVVAVSPLEEDFKVFPHAILVQLYARVLPFHSGLYQDLDPTRWYKVGPLGIGSDGCFWIVSYGLKVHASRRHFEVTDHIGDRILT